jgi:hypothetical protein
LSSLAVVAALLVASVTAWLQTGSGRSFVGRALVREVNRRLALTLAVGRISGSVIDGIRLEHVTVHDPQGRLVARADALSARYRLQRLVRRHEIDEIAVVRPRIVLLPSPPAAAPPGEPTELSVHELTISDGSIQVHGQDLQHLQASASIRSGPAGREARVELSAELHGAAFAARGQGDWTQGRLTARLDSLDVDSKLVGALHARGTAAGPIDALDLKLRGRGDDRGFALGALVDVPGQSARLTAFVATPTRSAGLRARGEVRGGTLAVDTLEAHTGATRLTGAGQVDGGKLRAALAARVAPTEAAVIGIHPSAPIRLRIALQGPPSAVGVRVHGRLRAARVALAGRVDLPAGRGRVHFVARDVRTSEIDRDAPELAFSGTFTFAGAVRERSFVEGRMSVADGSLRVGDQRFERLQGAARVRFAATGEARVESLSGQLRGAPPRPVELRTVFRWDPRALSVETSHAVLQDSRATGSVVYRLDPRTRQPLLVVHARTLSLSPSLIQEAFHQRPSKAWPGSATAVWTPEGTGLTFALDTGQGRLNGAARLRRQDGGLEAPSVVLALRDSRLRGAARVRNGELVASVDELLLQPALVYALVPPLKPALPLRFQGAIAGPLHALDLRLIATSGPSTVLLAGRIDARTSSFRLTAALDNFQMARSRSSGRITLQLSLLGRVVEGGVAGTLTVRHASGTIQGLPLYNARLDATLDGPRFTVDQVLLGAPGAVLEGKGGGTYSDFDVGYGVVITDALQLRKVPKPLRLMVGVTALTPGRSVVGHLRRHAGGNLQLSYHAIPPPFRVVNLLYHALKGHPLHLTVQ